MYCKNEDKGRDYYYLFPTTRHNNSPTRIRDMSLEPHHHSFTNGFCHLYVIKTLLSERYIEYILIRVIGWTVFIWTLNLAQIKRVVCDMPNKYFIAGGDSSPVFIYQLCNYKYRSASSSWDVTLSLLHAQSNTPMVCISFYWAQWCIFTKCLLQLLKVNCKQQVTEQAPVPQTTQIKTSKFHNTVNLI
jgi:hypothetical protein